MPWLALAVLAAWMLHLCWPSSAIGDDGPAMSSAPSLVHWKDADHDWLLVVDQAAHELVVYDANDGRPLRRLGITGGAGSVEAIVGEGDWLVVRSHQHPRLQVLSLPGLQPVALAGR